MPVIQDAIPVVLSAAGSDCSSGAGAQADLKTFTAHGVYGLTALTCVVAELPGKVTRIDAVAPEMLAEQLRVLLQAFPVRAMKTGMVPTKEHVEAICEVLDSLPPQRRPALVVDPVMVATSGDRLVDEAAVEALSTQLFPRALLVTPNMAEAAVLIGREVKDAEDLEPAARDLMNTFGTAVLVKGGHLEEGIALDLLVTRDGSAHRLEAITLPGRSTHGTGCTLSSSIAAHLALGDSLEEAVANGKRYVHAAIDHLFRWNSGCDAIDALNHFAQP